MSEKQWQMVVAALGVLGLVVSWVLFFGFYLENGLDVAGFWTNALWTGDGAGLTWDLIFSGFIVTALAVRDRGALGAAGLLGVCLVTAILGVCGGLALYVVLAKPVPS